MSISWLQRLKDERINTRKNDADLFRVFRDFVTFVFR